MLVDRDQSERAETRPETLAVLFDRDCGFCGWTVAQLRRLDRRRRLEFVPLQEAGSRVDRPALSDAARLHRLQESIHVVAPDGSVLCGGQAVLAISEVLPGGPIVRRWSRLPGAEALVEVGYRLVARNRGRLGALVGANRTLACGVPLAGPGAADRHSAATPHADPSTRPTTVAGPYSRS